MASTTEKNLAVDAAHYSASSIALNSAKRGPDHAVSGATHLDFWEAEAAPPGWWECELNSPRAARCFSFNVYDGILDPSSFSIQGSDDGEEWITLLKAENETGFKGQVKVYEFENARCFKFYRIHIDKTMGGPASETAPFLKGVTLCENDA
jgi:hypothetical protein